MIYWIDAQLPPQLADWPSQTFNVKAYALRNQHLRDAEGSAAVYFTSPPPLDF